MNEFDLVGTTLNQYQILDELGRGGMAVVYKAWQASLRRYVAIKLMLPQLLSDQEFVGRFRQEAVVAANLNHPNIVTIYEVGEYQSRPFIVMEHITGRSLEEIILSEGAISLERAISILFQVADALDFAHARQFIHRDIKPANILVGPEDKAVITDFGIAKALEGSGATVKLTSTGTIIGSPAYMSPEQVLDQGVDYRTDLYSLGLVAYEMLSGRAPFHGSTTALLYAQVNTPPPRLGQLQTNLPQHVEPALMRMLAKQPSERYVTASAFVHTLRGQPLPKQEVAFQTRTSVMSSNSENLSEQYRQPTDTGSEGEEDPASAHSSAWDSSQSTLGRKRRRFVPLIAALFGVLLLLGGGALYYLFLRPPDVEEVLEEANKQLIAERYEEAIAGFRDVLEDDPDNVEAMAGIGRSYEEQGKLQSAVDWYVKWTQTVPDDVNARMDLGQTYYKLEDYEEALAQFERVIELQPDNAEAHNSVCHTYYTLENYDSSVKACSDALEIEERAATYLDLAGSYYGQGDYESALNAYQEYVELAPENAYGHTQLGWVLFHLKRYEDAVTSFSTALEIDETPGVYMGLADSYYRLGDYEAALEFYQEYVELEPGNAHGHAQLGWVLFHLKRYEDAVTSFSAALEIDETPGAYLGLADSYYLVKNYVGAIENYQAFVSLRPQNAHAYGRMGWSYVGLDDCENARSNFDKALEIDAESEAAQNGLDRCP
jgi:serine/threonine-protein kinase